VFLLGWFSLHSQPCGQPSREACGTNVDKDLLSLSLGGYRIPSTHSSASCDSGLLRNANCLFFQPPDLELLVKQQQVTDAGCCVNSWGSGGLTWTLFQKPISCILSTSLNSGVDDSLPCTPYFWGFPWELAALCMLPIAWKGLVLPSGVF
jgi:hypothetical protein